MLVDYNFIELCALGDILEHTFGESRLAEIIRDKIDPHCFTASKLEGVALEEFLALNNGDDAEKLKFQSLRRLAKVLNFAIPSGSGTETIIREAAKYDIPLSTKQAQALYDKISSVVYPEMRRFIQQRTMQVLANNLQVSADILWRELKKDRFSNWSYLATSTTVRNIVRGRRRRDGENYSPLLIREVWSAIWRVTQNPTVLSLLEPHAHDFSTLKGSEEFYRLLFSYDVCTRSGRVRANVTHHQACNTQFCGLAADGAKLALFNLTQIGYRIVGFVVDEVIIEIADRDAEGELLKEIEFVSRVICESMEEVIPSIPITCKYQLSKRLRAPHYAIKYDTSLCNTAPLLP